MHRKKRIELIVEAAVADRLLRAAEEAGATGHTMIRDVAGKGRRGLRDEAHVSGAFRNVMIVIVASEAVAARVVEASQRILARHAGIVLVSDVEVLRDDHF
ncbi:MAG: hypothetical protein HMLKMBBP_00048 [Planctomycetes bacterium]|nr:hypothetical protein [Planctomycetota bacterium]